MSAQETFKKAVACAGEPLQRHLETFLHSIPQPIDKVTLGDIVCYR